MLVGAGQQRPQRSRTLRVQNPGTRPLRDQSLRREPPWAGAEHGSRPLPGVSLPSPHHHVPWQPPYGLRGPGVLWAPHQQRPARFQPQSGQGRDETTMPQLQQRLLQPRFPRGSAKAPGHGTRRCRDGSCGPRSRQGRSARQPAARLPGTRQREGRRDSSRVRFPSVPAHRDRRAQQAGKAGASSGGKVGRFGSSHAPAWPRLGHSTRRVPSVARNNPPSSASSRSLSRCSTRSRRLRGCSATGWLAGGGRMGTLKLNY